jgi:hypothetical protein
MHDELLPACPTRRGCGAVNRYGPLRAAAAGGGHKPNFPVVFTDDQGYSELDCAPVRHCSDWIPRGSCPVGWRRLETQNALVQPTLPHFSVLSMAQ